MDRMLFNSDATKLLSELQYLKQNHYQNHSRDTGSPAVTQVTQLVTQLVTKLLATLLVLVLDFTLVSGLQRDITVAGKRLCGFCHGKTLLAEILTSSLVASILGALTKE